MKIGCSCRPSTRLWLTVRRRLGSDRGPCRRLRTRCTAIRSPLRHPILRIAEGDARHDIAAHVVDPDVITSPSRIVSATRVPSGDTLDVLDSRQAWHPQGLRLPEAFQPLKRQERGRRRRWPSDRQRPSPRDVELAPFRPGCRGRHRRRWAPPDRVSSTFPDRWIANSVAPLT